MTLELIIKNETVVDYSLNNPNPIGRELTLQIQKALINDGYNLAVDGIFGKNTREALNDFKDNSHLGFPDKLGKTTAQRLLELLNAEVDFSYRYPPVWAGGKKMIVQIPNGFVQTALSAQDYKNVAREYSIEEAALRAVVEVESAGSGFLLNEPAPARPKILFEAHWFFKLTNGRHGVSNISQPRWNRSLYVGGSGEWDRLYKAMELNQDAALQSASWGLGQVMGFNQRVADGDNGLIKLGFNYKFFGKNNVFELVQEAHISELFQLTHMMNFIRNNNLIRFLQARDWDGFALRYNGTGYRQNAYDTKLLNSYNRWKRILAR